MEIGKNWEIKADSLNVVLSQRKRRVKKDTGEVYYEWSVMGNYSTPKEALQGLINQGVRDTQLKDLKTVVAEIDKLGKLIRALPKNVTDM